MREFLLVTLQTDKRMINLLKKIRIKLRKSRLRILFSPLSKPVRAVQRFFTNRELSCPIPHSTKFHHGGWGVFIAPTVKLGENVTIYHNVTITDDVIVGDNVIIYPGCIILRGVKIGDNVVIGASTLVAKNIPKNTRIINERKNNIKKLKSS